MADQVDSVKPLVLRESFVKLFDAVSGTVEQYDLEAAPVSITADQIIDQGLIIRCRGIDDHQFPGRYIGFVSLV
ncbi:hypothetical protein CODIS_36900 [Candidatus Thiodiazotropha endolucinida]|uniref:Uncharacterized protein n=1 Tax=Candidatus Thiodiazotropha endolucinida TaxID=1655433 RepID=A0A7Z0VI71_9GAMM|nr:hypothetical protein CODIS_36900 [Candidatus Thiodiazotropha endolucinida]